MREWTNFYTRQENGVMHLILATQSKGNSYNAVFWEELKTFLHEIKSASDIRVLTLSAEGKHFGGGMNVDYLATLNQSKGDDPARYNHWIKDKVLYFQAIINQFEALPFPVIGAANGACIGGSLALFAACDLRIATECARFSIHEINVGIMCDLGTIQRVQQLCGQGFAAQMAFTGNLFSARDGLAAGLIGEVVTDQESMISRLDQLSAQLAALSPLAMSGVKATLCHARNLRFDDSLQLSAVWNAGMYTFGDVTPAIRAQQEKRQAIYADLYHGDTENEV
ncbi:enoyl-CoA hydratase-related protein [Spongiibacter taiwanensis]